MCAAWQVMDKLQEAKDLARKWIHDGGEGCSAADVEGMHSEQMVVMLDEVLTVAKKLEGSVLAKMEECYALSDKKNSVRARAASLAVAAAMLRPRKQHRLMIRPAWAERVMVGACAQEIRMRWQMLCVASGWEDIYPKVVEFLEAQGRMKFVRPLYRNLYRTGGAGKELALATFAKNKTKYHNIAAKMIARDLELAS